MTTERSPAEPVTVAKTGKGLIGKLLPLILLAVLLSAFFIFDLDSYISFQSLKDHRESLQGWVANNFVLAHLAMVVIYAIATASSLPIGLVLTIAAGFLFGWFTGGVLVVVGATIGATAIFLAARHACGDYLRSKVSGSLKRMEEGFRADALNYMLVLRLVPLFPFWLVNIAPAFLGVTTRTYVLSTFFGIIPGTFVYSTVGGGLGMVFDRGETPDLGVIFEPTILAAILGIAVLALIPVIYKKLKRRGPAAGG